jgi:hypothetical protein
MWQASVIGPKYFPSGCQWDGYSIEQKTVHHCKTSYAVSYSVGMFVCIEDLIDPALVFMFIICSIIYVCFA